MKLEESTFLVSDCTTKLPHFPCGSAGKKIRLQGGRPGFPLQYSGLENSMDYSRWGRKESDTTERLSLSQNYSHQDSMVLTKKQKYKPMEQDRKPRDKPTHL